MEGDLWWIALVSVSTVVGFHALQRALSCKVPRNRQAFEVLPTTGIDPVLEDVLRFARQLAQAQRGTSRRTPLPAYAAAMRVRLPSDGGLTLRAVTAEAAAPARP